MAAPGDQVRQFMQHQFVRGKAALGQEAKPTSELTLGVSVRLCSETRAVPTLDAASNKDALAFQSATFGWPFVFR